MNIHPRPEHVERDKIPPPLLMRRPDDCRELAREDGAAVYAILADGTWAAHHCNFRRRYETTDLGISSNSLTAVTGWVASRYAPQEATDEA